MKLVHVEFAADAENPSDIGSNWKLHSFARRHFNYTDPDKLRIRLTSRNTAPVVYCVGLRRKLEVGLAFWVSYYEHGNCIWFLLNAEPPGTEMVWDGVRFAGLLVWPHSSTQLGAQTREQRVQDAASFLRHYTAWCNGELLQFSIRDETDPDGLQDDVIWSCDYIDAEALIEDAAEWLKPGIAFKIAGEASHCIEATRLQQACHRKQLSRQSCASQLVACNEP